MASPQDQKKAQSWKRNISTEYLQIVKDIADILLQNKTLDFSTLTVWQLLGECAFK